MWPTHYIPSIPRSEGVAPPRYYLTTPPYPIELVEELAANVAQPELYFVPSAEAEDYLTVSGYPLSGVLVTRLLGTSIDPEYIEATGYPLSAALVTRLVTYTVPPESLEATGIPLSGELKDNLVTYANWPLGYDTEDLTATGIPLSGVLA